MTVLMTGLDHETAPVELREKLAFKPEEARAFLPELIAGCGSSEGVLLSTCNRTEFYHVSPPGEECRDAGALLAAKKGLTLPPSSWLRLGGRDALRRLFRVAAGLESLVRGEAQILGQVKEAFRNAVEAMTTGPVLNRVFHAAFRAGKRARTETGISEGAVSVSHAAVELASSKGPSPLSGARIVVIGAGEMAGLLCRHLRSKGAARVVLANRTVSRAQALAEENGFRALGLESLPAALHEADVVFSAAACDGLVVAAEHLRNLEAPILAVDIGIPRTIDPAAGALEKVTLLNIDDLKGAVEGNLRRREEESARAAAIVEDEVDQALKWLETRKNSTLIQALGEYMEFLRARELKRVCREETLTEREKLERLSTHIVKKITQPLIRKINDARANGDSATLTAYLSLLKDVFGIS